MAGHTRLKAAKKLGLKTVPCVIADDLTEEQIRAYRLADNKTSELATWDLPGLKLELKEIKLDMPKFGFDLSFPGYPASSREDLTPYRPEPEPEENKDEPPTDWFSDHDSGAATDEDSEEYQAFVEKFKPKKTTDDCYTPDNVYETVVAWVAEEYRLDRACFVRPFYPGGDYQREQYAPDCVVVDNPPFSILAEIIRFYVSQNVRFFLFAPTLTLFSSKVDRVTYIPVGASITYENGASVATSFVTNLDNCHVRTAPNLYKAIDRENDINLKALHKELPKYSYPDYVLTAAMVAKWSKYGVNYRLDISDCAAVSALDEQKTAEKTIFGTGLLLSERAAAERAAAERAAAERAAAHKWRLSDRELAIVKSLGDKEKGAADVSIL